MILNQKKKTAPATKADMEEMAVTTAKEFSRVHTRIDALDEKVETGFSGLQQEMHDGFRAILAAVESVEYTKLRLRIDTIERDVKHIKAKLKT